MPRVTANSRAGILEWLELEACGWNAYRRAEVEKTFAVRRYEMRHRPPLPDVPMQPETAIHGVNHSFAP